MVAEIVGVWDGSRARTVLGSREIPAEVEVAKAGKLFAGAGRLCVLGLDGLRGWDNGVPRGGDADSVGFAGHLDGLGRIRVGLKFGRRVMQGVGGEKLHGEEIGASIFEWGEEFHRPLLTAPGNLGHVE